MRNSIRIFLECKKLDFTMSDILFTTQPFLIVQLPANNPELSNPIWRTAHCTLSRPHVSERELKKIVFRLRVRSPPGVGGT